MKLLPITAIALFSAISSYSQAADHSITICTVQSNDNGRAYIEPCGGWTTKNNCPSAGSWLTWDATTPGGQLMYSTALAALAAKLQVSVRTDGSSCVNYDVTSMIRVKNN